MSGSLGRSIAWRQARLGVANVEEQRSRFGRCFSHLNRPELGVICVIHRELEIQRLERLALSRTGLPYRDRPSRGHARELGSTDFS
jgi:hypothetical protein